MKPERKAEDLSPQERIFCAAYADAESETYGNALGSARVAKYKAPRSAASRLVRRPACRALIDEFYEKNASNIGRVMSDLRAVQLKAEKKDDLSTVVACLKLQGERYGMFSSRNIIISENEGRQRELDDAQRKEAQRLADILAREAQALPEPVDPVVVYPL
jgi:hypothetical protein